MKIQYIGKKPEGRKDTVAGTGLVWSEPGDVLDVDPRAAKLLLKHPDIWAEAKVDADKTQSDEDDLLTEEQNAEAERRAEEAAEAERLRIEEEDQIRNAPPQVNLNDLDADGLRAYAMEHYQHTFPHNAKPKTMRNAIIGLANRE